jgi:sensor histidine kinase YesM
MSKGLPRWFRLVFVLVMIVLCFVVVTQLISQRNYNQQLDELRNDIEIANGQLAKQKKDNRDRLAEKAAMEADIAILAPIAEAEQAKKDALKAEKKALKQEVTSLELLQSTAQEQEDFLIQTALEFKKDLDNAAEDAE